MYIIPCDNINPEKNGTDVSMCVVCGRREGLFVRLTTNKMLKCNLMKIPSLPCNVVAM